MGRIHRYGQRKDCLIFNFVATNTIEGRVLQRAKALFGEDGARAAADWIESDTGGDLQAVLFPEMDAAPGAEQDRGPDFLRLANALSALYPKGSEEKRLLDAMLLPVPR